MPKYNNPKHILFSNSLTVSCLFKFFIFFPYIVLLLLVLATPISIYNFFMQNHKICKNNFFALVVYWLTDPSHTVSSSRMAQQVHIQKLIWFVHTSLKKNKKKETNQWQKMKKLKIWVTGAVSVKKALVSHKIQASSVKIYGASMKPHRHIFPLWMLKDKNMTHLFIKEKPGRDQSVLGVSLLFPPCMMGKAPATPRPWAGIFSIGWCLLKHISCSHHGCQRGELHHLEVLKSLQMMAWEPPEKNGSTRPKLIQDLAGACWSSPSLYGSQQRHQTSTRDRESKKKQKKKREHQNAKVRIDNITGKLIP